MIVFISSSLLGACQNGTNGELDEIVNIGTHSLDIRCQSQGSNPTVVIDTGVGDTLERWSDIQTEIAKFTHVCTYNRAGYGSSEPGPFPRHSQRLANELHVLLENARIKGSYVLVGHSLGKLNTQIFADRYPDQFAGQILLDPPPTPFITGQAFPELYQMLANQTAEFQNMAEAARNFPDPEA
jgi:pimeloyl-ACP methyl ester carboxylesterase